MEGFVTEVAQIFATRNGDGTSGIGCIEIKNVGILTTVSTGDVEETGFAREITIRAEEGNIGRIQIV